MERRHPAYRGYPITTRGDLIVGDANGNPARLGVGSTDQVLTSDGTDAAWGAAPGIASGTLMLFQQTAAPTGWTKQTTHNNKSIRVVSGTAGSGGATAFTSVFGSGKTTGAHTLTIGEMASHDHTTSDGSGGGGNIIETSTGKQNSAGKLTNTRGGGGSHTHTLSLDLQYVDLIIASKD